jgi:hypothetical protein
MKKTVVAALLLTPLLALAADPPPTQATPPMPPPSSVPPLPGTPPAPPPEQEAAAPAPGVAVTTQSSGQGQWVFTDQYGWIWMPYGQSFTYLPTTGAVPQMYVYYPAVGWSWVVAPWVWGLGRQPYFGVIGPAHYVWWGRGLGHWYGFRGDYARWAGRGYYAGGRWYGHRDVFVVPHHDAVRVGHGERGEGHGRSEEHHR